MINDTFEQRLAAKARPEVDAHLEESLKTAVKSILMAPFQGMRDRREARDALARMGMQRRARVWNNITAGQAAAPKPPMKEGVGTDDNRESGAARNRALGFDRPVDPVNVVESPSGDKRRKTLFGDMTEAAMQHRRPGTDPSNARGMRTPSLTRPFKLGATGTQFQLRPKIKHGKFAIHGPGDVSPKFRFHNERIATKVAELLQRRTKQPHSIVQNDYEPFPR